MKPEQIIPADAFKAIYVEQLELKVDDNEIKEAAQAIQARAAALQKKYDAIFESHGLKSKDWDVNLKTGRMTPTAPKLDAVPPPDEKQPETPAAEGTSEDSGTGLPDAPADPDPNVEGAIA